MAGAIYRLGVHFCSHLIGGNSGNLLGHYECRQWWNAGQAGASASVYRVLVNSHRASPVWAVKDTWGFKTLSRQIKAMGDECRVIVMHRSFPAAVQSCRNHDRPFMAESEMTGRYAGLFNQLLRATAPVLHIDFYELVEKTEATIARVVNFIYDGLDILPSVKQIDRAIDFIHPEFRHYGRAVMAG